MSINPIEYGIFLREREEEECVSDVPNAYIYKSMGVYLHIVSS